MTNLDEVWLFSYVTHAVHDQLVHLEVTLVSWSSGGFIVLSEGWLSRFITRREHGQEVLVVSEGEIKQGFLSPDLEDPILKGLEASLDSDVPGTFHILFDVFRGVGLEVVEGKLGQLTAGNDLSQVRNLFHSLLKLF